jgi:hypothetical protein
MKKDLTEFDEVQHQEEDKITPTSAGKESNLKNLPYDMSCELNTSGNFNLHMYFDRGRSE